MKKNILLLMGCLGVANHASSALLVPVTQNAETTGVSFSYSIKNEANRISNTFMSGEPVRVNLNFKVKKEEVGQEGDFFVVAYQENGAYQKLAIEGWVPWDGQGASLRSFQHKILEKEEIISVFDANNLPIGEYLIYSGYKSVQSEEIFHNETAVTFVVFDKDSAGLHQIKNKSLLASYFAHGSSPSLNKSAENLAVFSTGDISVSFSGDNVPTRLASLSDSSSVSQTNLQEKGVDEADRIKTDGKQLYALEACEGGLNTQCITSYDIQSSPAANQQRQKLDIESNSYFGGSLYLTEVNSEKKLIHIGGSEVSSNIFGRWFSPYSWQNNETNIKMLDVSNPSDMKISTHINVDAAILSSRLIDGILYLVTRKNPYFTMPPLPMIAEDVSIVDKNPVTPKEQTVEDLLPSISFNDGAGSTPLVQATDCYMPNQDSSKGADNTVITITAIPLDNPKSYYSSCIVGGINTFYMSTNAMYLATSRYSFFTMGNSIRFPQHSVSTEIHKFSLGNGVLDYRGSGTVPGHLGWNADKQPFRMGENKGILKVATSSGMTWDNTSTTRVSVLREASEGKKLEEISFLDNLGKPGERLFAARFIQDKGYLVTFKQTDPLYVLDFKNPEVPAIVGELEINGYSDYLHPVGDNYLLGIGKDAVPNEDNPEFGGLYQGVKLSLFDVSSAENLREVSSIVIGKRGTESAVLSDHHALAWLPKTEADLSTLAIPVQLNNKKVNWVEGFYDRPEAHYGWTHTGLYTFSIATGDKPEITLQGKLITDIPPEECNEKGNFCSFLGQQTRHDRAVIQDDSIHYIHNDEVLSSAIADLK